MVMTFILGILLLTVSYLPSLFLMRSSKYWAPNSYNSSGWLLRTSLARPSKRFWKPLGTLNFVLEKGTAMTICVLVCRLTWMKNTSLVLFNDFLLATSSRCLFSFTIVYQLLSSQWYRKLARSLVAIQCLNFLRAQLHVIMYSALSLVRSCNSTQFKV